MPLGKLEGIWSSGIPWFVKDKCRSGFIVAGVRFPSPEEVLGLHTLDYQVFQKVRLKICMEPAWSQKIPSASHCELLPMITIFGSLEKGEG